jgi:hypothetical protein
MYRSILKYIFLIFMCLSFYTHILIENSGQSDILKTVLLYIGGSIIDCITLSLNKYIMCLFWIISCSS